MPRVLLQEKNPRQLIHTTSTSNILPLFWSKVMKLKFYLSISNVKNHQLLLNFISFVRRVILMNSIFFRPLPLPLLKKEDNKEKPRHFTRSKCISKMHCALLQGKQRQKLLLNRLHVVTDAGFQLFVSNRRTAGKYQTNSALVSCTRVS